MIQTDWLNILLLLGAVQGFFMAFLLWQKKWNNAPAVKYLLYLLLLVSVLLAGRAALFISFLQDFGLLILLPDVILFLIGPMLYFFVRSLLHQALPPKPHIYWHYLPALIHVFVLNTIVGLHLEDFWRIMTRPQLIQLFFFIEGAAILSMSVYLFWSMRYYRNYKEEFYQKYTAPFLGEFLRPIGIGAILILSIWTFGFVRNFFVSSPDYTVYLIIWFLLVFLVYFLAFKILISPELLEIPPLKPEKEKVTIAEIAQEDLVFLDNYMKAHHPFLNSELKISDLAEAMQVPRQELSKWINQGLEKNFFDFINEYRVREFVRLKQDPDFADHNTLELAFQSGFNSKSAFNRAFRKATGHSPRTYFEQHKTKLRRAER